MRSGSTSPQPRQLLWLRWRARRSTSSSRRWPAPAVPEFRARSAAENLATAALMRRERDLKHRAGLAAPDDFLPLLARAAPAFAALSHGSNPLIVVRRWPVLLDLQKTEPRRLRACSVSCQKAGFGRDRSAHGRPAQGCGSAQLMATTAASSRREAFAQMVAAALAQRTDVACRRGRHRRARPWHGWSCGSRSRATRTGSTAIETDRAMLANARRLADEIAGLARSVPSVRPCGTARRPRCRAHTAEPQSPRQLRSSASTTSASG